MQRFVRSSIAAVLSIAALAACGDKVTVQEVQPAAPHVTRVDISGPTSYLLTGVANGDSLTYSATVVADPGFGGSRNVTWKSSNTGVFEFTAAAQAAAGVTGGATGKAKAAGSAVITATSTVDGVSANIVLTVTAGGGGQAATVNISTVTQNGLLFPVQLNNVAGQIDVTMNVEPGAQRVDSLQLIVQTTGAADQVVASQRISGAAAAAAAASLVPQQITLSFNTSVFDTTGTCASPPGSLWGTSCFNGVRFLNGNKNLTSRIWVNGQTSQPLASNTIPVIFNNIDGFYVSQLALNGIVAATKPTGAAFATPPVTTTDATQNFAFDAAGRAWFQGGLGLRVRTVPVVYSNSTPPGQTVAVQRVLASRTINVVQATGVNAVTGGALNAAVTSVVATGAGPLTTTVALPATLADTAMVTITGAIATDGFSMTLTGPLVSGAAGDPPGIINSLSVGVPGFGNTALLANAFIGRRYTSIRLDNAVPTGVNFSLVGDAGTATGLGARPWVFNWVNNAYVFAPGLVTNTLAGAVCGAGVISTAAAPTAACEPGVGYVNTANVAAANLTFGVGSLPLSSVLVSVGPQAAIATPLAAANSAVSTQTGAGGVLQPSDVNNTYSATARVSDLLGNATTATLSVTGTASPATCVGGGPAGNCNPVFIAGTARQTFGVDILAPRIRYADAAGIAATGSGIAADPAILPNNVDSARVADNAIYRVDYIDDRAGFVGSGAVSGAFTVPTTPFPQFHTLQKIAPAAASPRLGSSATTACVSATFGSGATCGTFAGTSYGGGAGGPGVQGDFWVRGAGPSLDGNVAGDVVGYYTYSTFVRDMAGNVSPTLVKRSAVDPGVPGITGFLVPATIAGDGPAVFQPTADDDLEITAAQLVVNYPLAAGAVALIYPFGGYPDANSSTGVFNPNLGIKWDCPSGGGAAPAPNCTGALAATLAATLTTPTTNALTINRFMDQLEQVTAAPADAPPAAGTTVRPNTVSADVRDVFGTQTVGGFTQAILASAFNDNTGTMTPWSGITGAGQINRWRVLCAAPDTPLPNRTTITLQLLGPTGQSQIPFPTNSIGVWQQLAVGPPATFQRLPGTYTVAQQDNGTNRIWTVTYTYANALAPTTTFFVRGIGMNNQLGTTPATTQTGNGLMTNTCTFTTGL